MLSESHIHTLSSPPLFGIEKTSPRVLGAKWVRWNCGVLQRVKPPDWLTVRFTIKIRCITDDAWVETGQTLLVLLHPLSRCTIKIKHWSVISSQKHVFTAKCCHICLHISKDWLLTARQKKHAPLVISFLFFRLQRLLFQHQHSEDRPRLNLYCLPNILISSTQHRLPEVQSKGLHIQLRCAHYNLSLNSSRRDAATHSRVTNNK